MKIARFKADQQLWMPITVVLFVILWFAPALSSNAAATSSSYTPTSFSWDLFNSTLHGDTADAGATLLLLLTAVVTGAAAATAAWLLQFPIAVLRAIIRFGLRL
jgi:hypothetical protein